MTKRKDINQQTDETGQIQIGPTSEGMVRIFVTSDRFELPMDFLPDEARDIAEELLAAAAAIEGGRGGGKRKK